MKKAIRKTTMGLLVLVFIVSMLAGCGSSNTPTSAPATTAPTSTPTPTTEAQAATPTPEPTKSIPSLPSLAGEEVTVQYGKVSAKITIPDGWSYEMINRNRVIMYDMPAKDKYERSDPRLDFYLGSSGMKYSLAKADGTPIDSMVIDGYELQGVLMVYANVDGFEYLGPVGDNNAISIAVVGFELDDTVILQIINSVSFSIGD